jgi:hypothetical protein
MATNTIARSTVRPTPTPPGGGVVADQFIEAQLDKTRRDVKLVDLFGSLMVLAAGIVGFLLVIAVVDHWIVPLGVWARWLLLSGMTVAAVWHFVAVVLPLLLGRINPIYAARTIEQSEPSLRNSLINYLMFREDRAGLRAGIFEALKQRAAADLSHVPVESAVDRTRLIRIGYALSAILALFAAYTILSPKNPLQTVRRVMLPWADIAPPTRVRIEDVQPGSEQVFHGDRVPVSAICYDLRTDEPVTLFYSSLDGRISDQTLALNRADTGLRYEGWLPPSEDGIQQDLIYRIEAGDAVTASYRLTVVPAPALLVQQIEYEYPSYTAQPKRIVERQGDVRGVEGTRVTIRAQANQPIRWATIVLDPYVNGDDTADATTEASNGNGSSELISMQYDGQQAWGSMTLEMQPDGLRPKHTAYLLRFETESGQTNSRAPMYRIEVTRDLTPEIEILTPVQERIELPVDRGQPIEVRAIDPDYGLKTVQLRAVAGGVDLLTETLLDDADGRIGQVIASYQFEPWKHALRPGDAFVFWAVAADNRVSPRTGQAEPNVARTKTYHVTILPPENPAAGGPEPTLADPSEDPNASPQQADDPMAGDTDPETSSDQPGRPDQPDPSGGQQGGASEQSPDGQGSSGADGSGGTSDPSSGSGESSSSTDEAGSSSSDSGGSSGNSAGGGTSDSSSGSDSSGSDAAGSSGAGGQSPAGDPGSQGGQNGGSQDSSMSGGGESSSSARPGESATGGQSRSPSGGTAKATGQQAAGNEPLHDGEVIEQTLEHIKSQQSGGDADQSAGGQDAGQPEPGQAGDASGQTPQAPSGGGQGERPEQTGGGSGQPDDSQPGGATDSGGEQGAMPSQQPNQQQGGASSTGGGQQQEDRNQGAGGQQEGSAGQSGDPQGPAQTRPESGQDGSSGGEPKQGGQGQDGQSGGGQDSQDQSGSPKSDNQNADRPKQGGAGGGQKQPSEGAQSPSQSSRQSDSQGDSQGDQSGGGGQGGGQGSQQQGNDSSGSQSSADQGAGASQESGAGDSASRPGSQQTADDPTNTPGTQKGYGSSTQPTPGGQGPGAASDSQSESRTAERPSGQPSPGDTQNRGQGLPLGGGRPGEADPRGFDLAREVPAGEEPNLEYARRTTDLVLEYLRDQQQKPDPKLLERLRWTEDDLRQFLDRWENLRRSSAGDDGGQRDLNDALRSLGLRPDQQAARRITSPADAQQGLRDAGSQSNPPAKYLEQFNAFRKGTARVDE